MKRPLLLAIFALVAACGQNLAQEPAGKFRERVDAAIAAGDTSGIATLAEQRCSSLDGRERQSCYEDFFLDVADDRRVTLALRALEELGNRRAEVVAEGHSFTHVIGIRAWKPGDDLGESFRSCTSLYQSGCYHGVLQAYLTSAPVDSARVVGVCDQIADMYHEPWLRFQCMHGLGHGLEMAWNWDLPKALAGCDWLHLDWDRQSCYGGAIMENAVASMPGGHHTSVRALAAAHDEQGAGGHGDHGAAGHSHGPTGEITFRMRDPDDPLYPCSILGERYQRACYLGHGSILLETVSYDFARGAQACDRVPETVREVCYVSLGTSASGITVTDTKKSIALCAKGHPDWQQWCYQGVVKNFIDVTADAADGVRFCREVPAGRNRDRCWRAVGEQILILRASDLDARAADCATTGEGEAVCRQAAGLQPKESSGS